MLATRHGPRERSWITRRAVLNTLRVALFAAAVLALHHESAGVNRQDVLRALRSFGWPRMLLALLCTAASFLTLGAIELLAIRVAESDAARAVPRRSALATGFLVHAFGQSIGFGVLTGAAVRLRAYARYGIDARVVARTTATVIASTMFALISLVIVALMTSTTALRVRQLAMFGWATRTLSVAIVVLCVVGVFLWRRAPLVRARWRVASTPVRIAVGLAALSVLDWFVTGTVFVAFIPVTSAISVVYILRAFVVANAVGVASQVPGGAGVLDATVLALLAPSASSTTGGALAAALVAYRVAYYILPLGAAMVVAAVSEVRRARLTHEAGTPARSLPPHSHMPTARSLHDMERSADALTHAAPAHRLEWLIDNADACDRMLDAIRMARRSVWISQLAFDADCVIYSHTDDDHKAGSTRRNRETVLADTLIDLAAQSVDVRILLNEHFLQNTMAALRRYMASAIAARGLTIENMRLRGVKRFPHFLHMKMVIVDGRDAFLLGSPFVNGYWDDARHAPVDARRPNRELSGRPLHDVSMRIQGPAVRQLEHLFADIWNNAAPTAGPQVLDGDALRLTSTPGPRHGANDGVRVVRTLPRRVVPNVPHGATEVLDALLDGFGRARSLIYVEHQYLTARPAVGALVEALRRERDLEVVIVVNQNPDLTAYRGWQNARLAESGLLGHPRVGVFTLWSAAPCHGRAGLTAINQVFVHSKVVTIDDRWALVGAANLDGLSLHSYGDDFTRRFARRVFRHVRNFEVSVVAEDSEHIRDGVTDLRTKLWSEHLDLPASALATRPRDGWLALWRARAADNVRTLSRGADPAFITPYMRGFVLPYSTCATPARQLADVGVRVDPARLSVQFNPGWLEVQFSPAWVRNIFA